MSKFLKLLLGLPLSIIAINPANVVSAKGEIVAESQIEVAGLPQFVDDFVRGARSADEFFRGVAGSAHLADDTLRLAQAAVNNLKVWNKPAVSNSNLDGILNRLFLDQSCVGVLSCSIIAERATVGASGQVDKGRQAMDELLGLIQSGVLDNADQQEAYLVLEDLQYALNVPL